MWDSDYSTDNRAGGGFFDEANNANSPSTDKKKNGPKRAQMVLPVVIGMINECPDEEFKIWGEQASIVKIVGIVRKFDVTSTKITYEVEDHTGSISAVFWLEQEAGNQPNIPVDKEREYVKIYGTLRTSGSEKLIMILRIAPLSSINELNTHLLEVVYVRYQMEKGLENESLMIKNNPGTALANSMMSFSNATDGDDEGFGMTPVQQRVYKIIKGCTNKIGMHRDQIADQFPKNQHRDVQDAIEFLVCEGHVFSTINHDHFKLTDA